MQVLGIRKNGTYILGEKAGEWIDRNGDLYRYSEFETIIEKPCANDIPFSYIH